MTETIEQLSAKWKTDVIAEAKKLAEDNKMIVAVVKCGPCYGVRTFPYFYGGGELIGGFNEKGRWFDRNGLLGPEPIDDRKEEAEEAEPFEMEQPMTRTQAITKVCESIYRMSKRAPHDFGGEQREFYVPMLADSFMELAALFPDEMIAAINRTEKKVKK